MQRPNLDRGLVAARVWLAILEDKNLDGFEVLRNCAVILVGIRRYPVSYGSYDDEHALLLDYGARMLTFNGNTDPGKTGRNEDAGKDYACLEEGVWFLVDGLHRGVPRRFREPSEKQAAAAGIPRVAKDSRAKGEVTVRRMRTKTEGTLDTGNFAINWHPGGTKRTGSAGCQTNPPDQYVEAYNAAITGMKAAGQLYLPYVLLKGPL